MQINYDTWNGNRNEGNSIIINSNKKQKLSDLLKRLDQKTYTQLFFDGDESFFNCGRRKRELYLYAYYWTT